MTARVMVTGSRSWGVVDNDVRRLETHLDCYVLGHRFTLIHGAAARGADKLADDWAARVGIEPERYPANWAQHGRRAGLLRNLDMVRTLVPDRDVVLCCWDGMSPGTRHAAGAARQAGVEVLDLGARSEVST